MAERKHIVISGVNLTTGGGLQVFKDLISVLSSFPDVDVTCLVHKENIFTESIKDNVVFFEFPDVKKSWLKRLWFEYFKCLKLSKVLIPDIWISMHDMTPRVVAGEQFVYCHNPSPFYDSSLFDLWFDYKFFLFSKLYVFLYKFNIKSNKAVIVQQEWLAHFFEKKFDVNTLIASPLTNSFTITDPDCLLGSQQDGSNITFFYPSLARTFKNFELILKAVEHIKNNNPQVYSKIRIVLTIGNGPSSYEGYLYRRFSHLEHVAFAGLLPREMVDFHYKNCDVVIFPSKLETWGLPISEAKSFNKPVIVADLPYAKETVDIYDKVKFIDVIDHISLAQVFEDIVNGQKVFEHYEYQAFGKSSRFASWAELCHFILK